MQLYKMLDRLCHIHKLIQQEATGSPETFAGRLHLSRSQFYCVLEELREYGAKIKYSRLRRTYYYTELFDIKINIRVLTEQEERKIYAGFSNKKDFRPILSDGSSLFLPHQTEFLSARKNFG